MKIQSNGEELGVRQILPQMMEVDNIYIVMMEGYDDEGNIVMLTEFVWFYIDNIPQRGKIKCFRHLTSPKCLTFSQMPGAKFYGPVQIKYSGVNKKNDWDFLPSQKPVINQLDDEEPETEEVNEEGLQQGECPNCNHLNCDLTTTGYYMCPDCEHEWKADFGPKNQYIE